MKIVPSISGARMESEMFCLKSITAAVLGIMILAVAHVSVSLSLAGTGGQQQCLTTPDYVGSGSTSPAHSPVLYFLPILGRIIMFHLIQLIHHRSWRGTCPLPSAIWSTRVTFCWKVLLGVMFVWEILQCIVYIQRHLSDLNAKVIVECQCRN